MSRAWPTFPPLPKPDARLLDPETGLITREWYRYLVTLDQIVRDVPGLALNDIADIDAPAPSNGQKLTFVTADAKWKGV